MFCGLNCDYENFISISSNTTQALATHFDFTSFIQFYSQGVFGLSQLLAIFSTFLTVLLESIDLLLFDLLMQVIVMDHQPMVM